MLLSSDIGEIAIMDILIPVFMVVFVPLASSFFIKKAIPSAVPYITKAAKVNFYGSG